MEPEEYARMFQAEQSHWWYRGMETLTRALLCRWYMPGEGLQILDAGCGTGAAMAGCLREFGRVTGVDLSPLALDFCRARRLKRLARASVVELPFAACSFDLVTSFDVLYESSVPDDARVVEEFSRLLVPGGRLLMRLPACDWLRGAHDRQVHTARRYSLRRASALLLQAGLALEHVTHANSLLFPLAVAVRSLEKLTPPAWRVPDLRRGTGRLNGLLQALLESEAPHMTRRRVPFGLSLYAVGRKTA